MKESKYQTPLAAAFNDVLVEYLRDKNLEENDMLLAKLTQSREKLQDRGLLLSEKDFNSMLSALDEAEAELLRIRSEI